MPSDALTADLHRSADRFVTATDGVLSRHSFSFGRHYDAANTSYGPLLAHNEDMIQPGAGYPTHPHRDLEIVTWVLRGALLHDDSTGAQHVLRPGSVQRVRAGSGLRHSELAAVGEPVHLVQAWLRPAETGLDPGYEQRDVEPELAGGGLVAVASGLPRHAGGVVALAAPAALHVARLRPGTHAQLPDAPLAHLFVARGELELEGAGALGPGDAARLPGGGRRISSACPAEVLVWELHPS